jgi:hypothetical protein
VIHQVGVSFCVRDRVRFIDAPCITGRVIGIRLTGDGDGDEEWVARVRWWDSGRAFSEEFYIWEIIDA